jgi:hypothetical protein
METPLPKEQLLLKLLKMTTSSNDGEALAAIRKANQLMASVRWDWDKLFEGKIKVVANPFANIPTPTARDVGGMGTAPHRPTATPASAGTAPPRSYQGQTYQPPPPPPPWRAKAFPIASTRANRYSGNCYCCGDHVGIAYGFIFQPHDYIQGATHNYKTVCAPCNQSLLPRVGHRAARAKPPLSDLL